MPGAGRKIYYAALVLTLSVLAVFGRFETTSEFDHDNFYFDEQFADLRQTNPLNTFPESGQAEKEEPKAAVAGDRKVDQIVPFAPQAPLAEWSDPRQQDGCEEASVIMAMSWLGLEKFDSLKEAKDKIIKLAAWQEENYGYSVDTSAADTNERLIREYYGYKDSYLLNNASLDDIKKELWLGRIILAPCDGRKLGNPNFTAPGPERHMVLIRGYDGGKQEFITNDPGTRLGEAYRYQEDVLYEAIRDYPSGRRQPITAFEKNLIVIEKDR